MVEVETEEVIKAMKVYHAAGKKTTYGKTVWAKGAKPIKNTTTRSKKNMSYDISSPPKMRSMNYDSAYNIPSTYDGVKIVMKQLRFQLTNPISYGTIKYSEKQRGY